LTRIDSDKLRVLWSPEQIAGWIKHTHPCDEVTACTRDHLSHPLHSSAWRLEEGAIAAFEPSTRHAPLSPLRASLLGGRNSQIATLVERQARYVMLAEMASGLKSDRINA